MDPWDDICLSPHTLQSTSPTSENAVKTSSVIIKRIDLAGRFFKRLILLQTTCILLNPIYLVCKWVLFWPQL